MNQRRGRGISWQASFTIGVAIVAVLYIIGSARGASVSVPVKGMQTELHAINYPAHARTVRCRMVGSVVEGTFRCNATLTHGTRRFYVRAVFGNPGWLCVGKTLPSNKTATGKGCNPLHQGFLPASLVTSGWQSRVVSAWIFWTTGSSPGSIPCTGSSSPVTCDNITLTYKHVKAGLVLSVH